MEHFYENIHGYPNLMPQMYEMMVKRIPADTPAHFVEVGCLQGASAAAMCVEIINSGKQIKFDCVDIWESEDNYEKFLKNLEPVAGYFSAIKMPSVEAAKLYEDNSLDFVCIDAYHSYECVKEDILSWFPKIKPGGILGGDDYLFKFNHKHKPTLNDYPVKKAVDEIFPQAKKIVMFGYGPRFWYVIKS